MYFEGFCTLNKVFCTLYFKNKVLDKRVTCKRYQTCWEFVGLVNCWKKPCKKSTSDLPAVF